MKTPFSPYLESIRENVKTTVNILAGDYDYVSALCTDSKGIGISVSKHARNITNNTLINERGVVFRVCRDKGYSEYAVNTDDFSDPAALAALIKDKIEAQRARLGDLAVKYYDTDLIDDTRLEFFGQKECEILPEEADVTALADRLKKLSDEGLAMSKDMVDLFTRFSSTHISKMFISPGRDLRQAYCVSEGSLMPFVNRDGKNKDEYVSVSGDVGAELIDELEGRLKEAVEAAVELLDATAIKPGEYEVITDPEVTGLIAHEAFGHGVEMDMFVKNRALGKSYVGKRVGSEQVTMHEGALCIEDVASYFFDDEGVMAGDVTEIDKGILKSGICDSLSALRLGTAPTGNGKRERFSHKVYTRMTNTIFDSGEYSKEEMISSVKYGYLLEGARSGMEDPKHWGIQCIVQRGREIKDGKLTGKVVSPIIMTGYVPDLLGNISMCSSDRKSFGSGACGKGYKEWVKVSDGGPYLKTIARLG
ncbi:TldD/PmbA family protein [Butyrivibrio sp. MC2013]|uniref:TldD/PmbA family protein n=1 Tax=Butyrivibrio sp. MC2013 TaxID=1280686 RepID=UPI0003F5801A|nr:TldD/PmbA family protein [Butyrivibrio sp. MC2013]